MRRRLRLSLKWSNCCCIWLQTAPKSPYPPCSKVFVSFPSKPSNRMLCTLSWLPLKMPRARWPPAWLGVTSSPGFTLWRLFSVVVACAHRNCLYKLCSSFSAHRGNSKTIAVNNMEGSTMELRIDTRFSTPVATRVAVRNRLWIFRIRWAQSLFTNSPVPIS